MRSDRARLRRGLIGALALLALGGCNALLPSGSPPPRQFTLSPKTVTTEAVTRMQPVSWQLVVEAPYAAQALNSPRIALLVGPMQFDQYARAAWTDRAPVLVQDMLVQSFDKTARIAGVGRETLGLRPDFVLRTELRDFQGEVVSAQQHLVRVQIVARLVRMPDRQVVGTQAFTATAEVDPTRLEDVVTGFDDALGPVMKQLVDWTFATGEANRRRPPPAS